MRCPGCGRVEVAARMLAAGELRCSACGADWRALAELRLLPRARFNDGLVRVARGDLAAAERAFREAVLLEPSLAPAWVALGKALAQRGRVDDAMLAFAEALLLGPDNEGARQALDWTRRSAPADDAGTDSPSEP